MDADIRVMSMTAATRLESRREAAGFLVSAGFVCLASVRDVYLGGLFQRVSPPLLAMLAFILCSAVFLPVGFVSARPSLPVLWEQRRVLFWVNVSTASAWIAFLYALKLIEPSVVQILYSGIGPLSVIWIEGGILAVGPKIQLTDAERLSLLALAATLILSSGVVLTGHSGLGHAPIGTAALGVGLAALGGVSISVSTMLCRSLNDAGVAPSALLAFRFPMTVVAAAVVIALSPSGMSPRLSWIDTWVTVGAVLIIVLNYVNQLAISLASPFTVRAVLAVAPVLIFFLQIAEGRLAASRYSLTAAILYGFAAIAVAVTRRHAIRPAAVAAAGTGTPSRVITTIQRTTLADPEE